MLRVVLANNPSPMTLDGTRTFVVGRDRPVVIDPGPADPAHLDAVEEALWGSTPVAILLTHAHSDHAAGAGELARRTGSVIWMAAGAVQPPENVTVDHWLADGEVVETDAGDVRAVATPGHAPEHFAFQWIGTGTPWSGAVFVGDLLMGTGDTTLVAPPEGDLRAYLHSLDRVAQLGAEIFFPSHGPPIVDVEQTVQRYRAHREARIQQVESALRRHPGASPAELVDLVYGDALHPSLRGAAQGSLRAILDFLSSSSD